MCCCAVCMVHSMCKEVSPLPPTQGSPSGLGKRRSLEFVWSLTEKKFGVCSEVSLSLGWKNQEAFETPLLRGVLALSVCVCVYVLCGCLVWLLCGCLVWLLVSFVCFVRVCVWLSLGPPSSVSPVVPEVLSEVAGVWAKPRKTRLLMERWFSQPKTRFFQYVS